MRSRPGVSLIEVLVATVLLAVGIAGTLSSLAAAERLRRGARDRENLAALALDRLAWFQLAACLTADTSAVTPIDPAGEARWSVRDSLGVRTLQWRGVTPSAPPQRLRLTTTWRCD